MDRVRYVEMCGCSYTIHPIISTPARVSKTALPRYRAENLIVAKVGLPSLRQPPIVREVANYNLDRKLIDFVVANKARDLRLDQYALGSRRDSR